MGIQTDVDDVVITGGSTQGLAIAARAVLRAVTEAAQTRVTNVAVMDLGILISVDKMNPVAAFHTMKRRASRKLSSRSPRSLGNGISMRWLPLGV